MTVRPRAIIFDIDGTIADTAHRAHFIERKPPRDWKSFYESMVTDEPHWMALKCLQHFAYSHAILLLTGRPTEYHGHTTDWLERYKISYARLYMRPDGDFRADYVLKKEIYQKQIEPFFDVRLVLEDRSSVVKMWRSLGLTCWQVSEGDY